MKSNIIIKFIAGSALITMIACQKIKKEETKSYSDWQTIELTELEKTADGKLISTMSCRLRPVENYHLYYTLYTLEKTSPKEEKVDKLTTKFYDNAYLGYFVYSTSPDQSSQSSSKLVAKKVKALIKKDELLSVLEIYEQEPPQQLTRAEEAAAAAEAEEQKKNPEANKDQKDDDKSKKIEAKSNKTTKEDNLNAFDKFTKGYKLILKLQKHSVTGEAKNLSETLPFNNILSDKESLKAVSLECQ